MIEKRIRAALDVVTQTNKDFVIYPFGKYGQMTKHILNEDYAIKENYVVDNHYLSEELDIKKLEYLKEDYKKRDFIILCVIDPMNWEASVEIHRNLDFVKYDRLVDVLSSSMYFCPWNYYEDIIMAYRPKIAIIESIAREVYVNAIEGAVAEAGVYKGYTARYINAFFPERKLYLFDTFEGFNIQDQEADTKRGMYHEKIDFSNTSVEYVLARMHYPENVVIKKGWFPESATDVDDVFAFVRLDMDLYDPIYSGLNFFYDKLSPGGYIVVHDCRSVNFDGAKAALRDFCKEKGIGYYISTDSLGSAIICKGY